MELPITGTTEFIANLTDLSPSASAFEATAVFTESIETNIAETVDMAVVITLLSILIVEFRFNSWRIPEQMPRAKKQFVTGIKISSDI